MTDTQTTKKTTFWGKMPLWQKILIGMVLGIITGSIMGPDAEILKPLGTLFIKAIKMLIVPLVFCSLVVGVTSMQDTRKMGRVGLKSIVLYLGTTAVAITIGLGLGTIFSPGAGLNMDASTVSQATKEAPTLVQTLLNMIPTNPVDALAAGNILQIIVFALGLGIALTLSGEKGKPAIAVFESLAEAMYTLTGLVMKLAPYGVFGLMAWVAGKYGLEILLPLIKVVAVVYLGSIIHVVIFYSGLISLLGRLSPIPYLKGIATPAAVAFTTTSSSGTLPASIKAAREELGVSKGISSFVLPLGATINMDGTALYQGVCALFIAQAFGVDLEFSDYIVIIATSTLASIGTAGVPGAGMIMLSLVLTTVGLPIEGLAIIAGIDRILDMARTTVNVCGDLMVSTLVAKSENELDQDIYSAQPTSDSAKA
ncbi:MAG: dicarboxylate/amino acid:cation symporter [Gammaproteobacteria bacterium]|jgi:Na+/H+-dicarboxylate symporter|uniref:dicarboxylate/amino acid:cation symporter n=1 Tax=Marinomonas sp. BSi20584 TaxID=1594462 RepID=UPI000C1DDF23|nr:dicarboxylate/amino acid:cation symporter [Marinomonas sp. BSi20584]MBU1293858.1 dicarboxylate/amino acid:cation symporter [Gammaproteobacteria bacterium]MBU1467722.1 dicarboxylate/amino acid:cation symporter [Gammaproteobacteria bacterium]MBU2023427.1 dicarboxylate/amino acid:cation symporter [Gammaproteobacteria bacterium]MBU2240739.1 dicarboxylate/amino acid:cation symporter [Gammaproteobacteria bacterium]MBU2317155.1 dicarboxylate/amino acid:cation symporter [Gammaproteobacteria bacteri